MNTRLHAALVLAAGLALAGCIPNDASVRLFGLCSIPDDAKCAFKPTCESYYLGPLEVDVGNVGASLVWPVQIDNQRSDNATADGSTTTSTAWLEGFHLKYSSSTPGVAIPDITVGVSSSPIPAKSSAVALALIVPNSVASFIAFSATPEIPLTVELVAFGRYGDGTTFETGPFSVETSTCTNCWAPFLRPVDPDPVYCQKTDTSTNPPTIKTGAVTDYCPGSGQTSKWVCAY